MIGERVKTTVHRSHLPPPDSWPHRVYTRPEFAAYPTVFNAAEELLGGQIAAGRADHPALVHGDETITYAQLFRRASRLGNALRDLGVGIGDRVMIRCLNEPPALVANFAALMLGAVVVPTSPLLNHIQLTYVIRDSDPAVLIVGGHLLHAVLEARPALSDPPHVVAYGAEPDTVKDAGCLVYDELVTAADVDLDPVRRPAEEIAVLLYTSGLLESTRATAHFQNELLIIPDGYGRHGWNVQPHDVVAGAGPISFAGGYSTVLTIPFRFGATSAIIPLATTPAEMFPLIRRHGITLLAALPTRYQEMLEVKGIDPDDLGSLRMVSGGGEPLAPATAAGWRARFGLEIHEGFGTNGMMHVFITTAVERTVKPGSMGWPLPGYTVRVLTRDGRDAGDGELGQLHVQGPTGTLFWGHPDAAADVAKRQRRSVCNGWVAVGDWVTRDADGSLSFACRDEDLLVREGEQFGPVEIERVLSADDDVAEVGVYEEQAVDAVTTLRALVVPTAGASPQMLVEELLDRYRAILGPCRVPDEVVIVDGLPRTVFGTLLRRAAWSDWLARHSTTTPKR